MGHLKTGFGRIYPCAGLGSDTEMLSFRVKALYGLGQMVWGVKDILFHFYLIFHYQTNLGLSASYAAAAALIGLFFDAVSDPIMAYFSDNHTGKGGRRHPFMAAAILPFALSLYLVFSPPDGLGQGGLFIWLSLCAITARLCVTVFIVPHTALSAELSSDYSERTSIFGYRIFFGYVGGMVMQGITLALLLPAQKGGTLYKEGYADMGLVAAILCMIAGAVSVLGTWDQIPSLPKAPHQRPPFWSAFGDFPKVFALKNFRAYMAGSVIFSIIIGVAETLIIQLFTFYYGFDSSQQLILVSMIFVALFPAYLLSQYLVHRTSKRNAVILCLLVGSLLGSGHVTLHLFGFLPDNGTNALLFAVTGIVLVNQTFIIAFLIVQGSMIGDMVDEYALVSKRRQEALFAAAQTFAQKLTFAIGAGAAPFIIAYSGFKNGMVPGEVPAETLFIFGFFVGPGLFVLSVIAAIPYIFYDLDKERLASIQACGHDAQASDGGAA